MSSKVFSYLAGEVCRQSHPEFFGDTAQIREHASRKAEPLIANQVAADLSK